MTEKRFQWVFIKDNELEFQDNGIVKRFENYRLEEFLNELNDENKELKEQVGSDYNEANSLTIKIAELTEENKELKKESYGNLDGLETYKALYHDLSEKYDNLEADYDDLKKENEQLKLSNRLLLEEMKEIRDKLTVYLEIRKGDV